MKKIIFNKYVSTAATIGLGILLPMSAHAISYFDPSSTLGLGSANLQDTVINIIRWVLGLLGLVAVIMILIGGFKWMTAAGNEEKIESAKKLLYAAIVGLVIIVLAWAIVNFALSTLKQTSGAA